MFLLRLLSAVGVGFATGFDIYVALKRSWCDFAVTADIWFQVSHNATVWFQVSLIRLAGWPRHRVSYYSLRCYNIYVYGNTADSHRTYDMYRG